MTIFMQNQLSYEARPDKSLHTRWLPSSQFSIRAEIYYGRLSIWNRPLGMQSAHFMEENQYIFFVFSEI